MLIKFLKLLEILNCLRKNPDKCQPLDNFQFNESFERIENLILNLKKSFFELD
jgi:hypothetical protein